MAEDNGISLFGFQIQRKKPKVQVNIVTPVPDEGTTVVNSAAAYYGLVIDLEGIVKNENDLIRRYRESAQYADCDKAVDEIVCEAIVTGGDDKMVTLNFNDLPISGKLKQVINQEFDQILELYNFKEKAHDLFRQWYIDGRLFFHIVLDETNPAYGIVELRPIDPRKVRKIKNVKKERNEQGLEVTIDLEEYYLYNDKGITEQTTQGVKISTDSIIFAPSGLVDANTNMVLGYLQKAIKPVNQLKMMEDALVIYRISRAPERRVFYIDVGNLPKLKAEQYVNDVMNKFRNKVVYDVATGEIKDNRQHLSLMEDFWMPRRGDSKSTSIETLDGARNLGEVVDIQYFQTKLYQALNVPITRLAADNMFPMGARMTEVTRDEIKFDRFVQRLRNKFCKIFRDALRVQLISKQIIRPEEWDIFNSKIGFDFQKDNHFTELKDSEIMSNRLSILQSIDPYVGRYFSTLWIRKNVLKQTEDEIEEMEQEMQYDIQMMMAQQEAMEQQADQQPSKEKKK